MRDTQPSSLSVVIPCYNEEEVLAELLRRVNGVCAALPMEYEIILIDDGSKDRTWEMLVEAASKDSHLKVIRLSRNHGHQLALTCGLDQSAGDVVLVIDADLQDPPELLPEMLQKWQEGYDVVYGKRIRRDGEGVLKRFLAYSFYRVINRLTKMEIPEDTGDFRLLDQRVVETLRELRERHRFIRGMVTWVGFRQVPLLYERPPRFAGETKYPIRKSLRLAIDAITSFSTVPLKLASVLGFGISAFAFLYIIVVIVLKILGVNFSGYTSIMASILLLGGVQLIVLGIIGEYVGRIFEQGQNRPLYLVDTIFGEPLREFSERK